MSLTEIKKSPLRSLPSLRKRLRRITGIGLRNLTVNELNFTVHFTLHRTENTVAFYTSELVENQRNPEWTYLQFPFQVQSLQEFVLRVWITTSDHCRVFLLYDVYLDESLTPDEQKDDTYRNNNSLWIEMFGYRFTDNQSTQMDNNNQLKTTPLTERKLTMMQKKSKVIQPPTTYNSSSLIKILTYVKDIRDTKRSSKETLDSLQTFLNTNQNYFSKMKERESRRVRVENLKQYYISQVSIYQRRLNSNQYRQKIINEKKNDLEHKLLQLLSQQEELNAVVNHLNQSKCLLHDLIHLTRFRQKFIIREIYLHIYPITIENKTDLCIANIRLPPAEDKSYLASITREREYEIKAAAGFCAHLVLLISQVLHIPLRFSIEYYGTPLIKMYDYNQQKPEYPLCPSYNNNLFQYALYLLNRDIGQIMSHCRVGRRRTDYRKSLQNLKDLMEQYFLNIHDQPQVQLFALTQPSIDSTILSNSSNGSNTSINDRPIMRGKRNSTANSIFSPRRSAISSALEINDDDEANDDNTHQVDLFPTMSALSPRLAMQFSQIQQQH